MRFQMNSAAAVTTTNEQLHETTGEVVTLKGSPLATKIAAIAGSVTGRVAKDGVNEFHGYRYSTESAILEAIRGKQAELQVAIVPNVLPESIHMQPVGNKGDILTSLVVEFTVIDGETGERYVARMPGSGTDKLDKGPYKAVTGASKYFLQKLYQLPTGDDPEQVSDAEREGQSQRGGRPMGRVLGGPRPAPEAPTAPVQTSGLSTNAPQRAQAAQPTAPTVQQPQRASDAGRAESAPAQGRTLGGPRPTPAAPAPAAPAPAAPPAAPAPAPAPAATDDGSVALASVDFIRDHKLSTGAIVKVYRVTTESGQRLGALDDIGEGLLGCLRNGRRVRLTLEQTQSGPKVIEFEAVGV